MSTERTRTLAGFETLRTVASPSPSPFHGWGDEFQTEPVQQSGHAQPVGDSASTGSQSGAAAAAPPPPPLYRQPGVPLRNVFNQHCGPPQADRPNVFGNQQMFHGQPANQQQQIQFPPNFGFGAQAPQHGAGQQLYGGQQLQHGGLQQQYPAYNQFQHGGVGAGPANPDPGRRAQPGPTQATASVATLRGWFPLLTNMPDEMLVATDLATLIALHKSLQPIVQQGSSDPMSVASQAAEMWAAAAAKISGSLHKPEEDPAIMMAKTLESLRSNPVAVAAGLDDRCTILHPARFLGGAVSAKALWRAAREVIGLNGVPPLSNYDMTCMGLGGCVTMRGWKEMANPGSPHNTLKLYSSSNMSSSTGATKRLSLADGSQAVNIGENLKEVTDLAELRLAVRTMCRAAQLILPWNMAYNAIDGFLHSSNYGMAELNGRANRATILTEFINYVLGLNAAAWIQKEDFLTSGEIKNIWGEWFGSRPASMLRVADQESGSTSSSGGGQGAANSGGGGSGRGRGRGRGGGAGGGGRQNNGGGGPPAPQSFTTPPPAPGQAGQGGSGGAQQNQMLCRRWNYGNCPNTAATCALPSGTRLYHRCDHVNPTTGAVCNKANHPRVNHR